MKKMFTMLMMAMMAMMTFTSCEDEMIADTLEGSWKGNMYISTSWNGRVYDATYTEITFLKDPFCFKSGSGYWVDYYSNAPWDYVANHIDWTVNNGVIHVYFIEEDTSIDIYDYRLSSSRFVGTLNDYGTLVDFDLYNVSHPYSYWDNYYWGYDEWYYDDYFWARTRGIGADSAKTIEKPKRFVNPNRDK